MSGIIVGPKPASAFYKMRLNRVAARERKAAARTYSRDWTEQTIDMVNSKAVAFVDRKH